jgi:hypothetical protein
MSYYAVSHIDVIGPIWMPNATAATSYSLTEHDIENMRGDDGKITRDDVEDWINCHSGDFRHVEDFNAIIRDGEATLEFGWSNEESDLTYNECVYGDEE